MGRLDAQHLEEPGRDGLGRDPLRFPVGHEVDHRGRVHGYALEGRSLVLIQQVEALRDG